MSKTGFFLLPVGGLISMLLGRRSNEEASVPRLRSGFFITSCAVVTPPPERRLGCHHRRTHDRYQATGLKTQQTNSQTKTPYVCSRMQTLGGGGWVVVRVLGEERMVPSPAFCSVTTLLLRAPTNRLHLRKCDPSQNAHQQSRDPQRERLAEINTEKN